MRGENAGRGLGRGENFPGMGLAQKRGYDSDKDQEPQPRFFSSRINTQSGLDLAAKRRRRKARVRGKTGRAWASGRRRLGLWGLWRLAVAGFFEAGGRMAGAVNLLQLLNADLGVNLGGGQFGVAKQLLDEADVGPVFEHDRGAGVAQQVA